ncbi:fungal specific transcription factor factor domain-containing protein [Fusarium mexicanum]|uniref:Fungal specific transcription factor factor domain-containing protein n=1 Tax=Fusarium mexicanum TaxID=751941 RepID=A0A8H5MVJ8_9HYPO|nr:fungal specific transcription factor factor domain-containing protein [Fusarium mexicanum]
MSLLLIQAILFASYSSSVRSDSNHSTLRRLWWCCIIRDRILPLDSRRSIQITPDHFDLKRNMLLGCIELEAEIGRSTIHCDDAKEGLSSIIKEVNTATNADNPLTQLQDCKRALARWYNTSPLRSSHGPTITADRAVVLHINVMYTYYQIFTDLEQLTFLIAKEKHDVAYIAFPLSLHIFDFTCSDTQMDHHPNHGEKRLAVERRLNILIQVMKIFHEQYDGVDGVLQAVRQIVNYARSCLPSSFTDTQLSSDSDLTLRVSLAMDLSLGTGIPSDAEDFTSYLGTLFQQPSQVELPVPPVETNDANHEETPQALAYGELTAQEHLMSDLISTEPPSLDWDVDTGETGLLSGLDETLMPSVPSDYEKTCEVESDLERRLNCG